MGCGISRVPCCCSGPHGSHSLLARSLLTLWGLVTVEGCLRRAEAIVYPSAWHCAWRT